MNCITNLVFKIKARYSYPRSWQIALIQMPFRALNCILLKNYYIIKITQLRF